MECCLRCHGSLAGCLAFQAYQDNMSGTLPTLNACSWGHARSGTTLLPAVLGAFLNIRAGAELIPVPIVDLRVLCELYAEAIAEAVDFEFGGRTMRLAAESKLRGVLTRCYRARPNGCVVRRRAWCLHRLRQVTFRWISRPLPLCPTVNLGARRWLRGRVRAFKLNSLSLISVVSRDPNAKALFLVRHLVAVANLQPTKRCSDDAATVFGVRGARPGDRECDSIGTLGAHRAVCVQFE